MELLLSTPITPLELILGKILPYSIIGMFAIFLVYLIARLGFNIPFRGSHLFFIFACFLFLTAYLAQGTLISVVARTQAVSMQMAMVSGFLPTMLLSGFIFSISSMPKFFQYFTMILPARWFLQIVRTLFLKEAGFLEIWPSLLALLFINFILINVSIKKFQRTLE
ncbi:MAG: ABC transporter permease [Oligoflexia bacterium]|nr:ABC transporter permease [Oligoflexia bacterium]